MKNLSTLCLLFYPIWFFTYEKHRTLFLSGDSSQIANPAETDFEQSMLSKFDNKFHTESVISNDVAKLPSEI